MKNINLSFSYESPISKNISHVDEYAIVETLIFINDFQPEKNKRGKDDKVLSPYCCVYAYLKNKRKCMLPETYLRRYFLPPTITTPR